jgi:5-methylcytosine-specific restriction protein A
MCQWPRCVRLADDVDHIRALALGGDRFSWTNLQSLCRPHHVIKTASDAQLVREQREQG